MYDWTKYKAKQIVLPRDLAELLKRYAKEDRRSFNSYITLVLLEHAKQKGWEE